MNEAADLFSRIRLGRGVHNNPEEGVCVMECVAHIQGEGHTDTPGCACPVISAFAIRTNDCLDDERRQALIPRIVRIAGSRVSREIQFQRAAYLMHYAVREYVPAMLKAARMPELAKEFAELPDVVPEQDSSEMPALIQKTRDALVELIRASDLGTYNEMCGVWYAVERAMGNLRDAHHLWSEGYLRYCVQQLSDVFLGDDEGVDRMAIIDRMLDIGIEERTAAADLTPEQLERLRLLVAKTEKNKN